MTTESVHDAGRFFEREMLASVEAFLAGARSWEEAVELGLPAMSVAPDDGGLGLDLRQETVAFEALGSAPYESPLFASSVLALPFLDAAEREALVQGRRVFTVAWCGPEEGGLFSPDYGAAAAVDAGGEWTVSGAYGLVPSVDSADAAVVIARTGPGPGVFLVELGGAGVERAREDGFDDTRPSGRLSLDAAPARPLIDGEDLSHAIEMARVRIGCLLAAEALGAGTSALDQSVAHVGQRHAFGRPLAGFQAVSHMCADTYTQLMVARGVLDWALAVAEAGDTQLAPLAAAAARAAAAEASLRAAERAIQLFGAMGFTWDAGLHLLLKRAQWIMNFDAPPGRVFEELAAHLAASRAGDRIPTTELFDSPEQAKWRAEARSWIDANLEPERRGLSGANPASDPVSFSEEWARRALEAGFATAHWPPEFGGSGRGIVDAGIASEEIARAHLRAWKYRCAIEIVAPSVLRHGRPDQKESVLAAIRAGQSWAQGFSEPDAGSDLAALQTSAKRNDSGFVLSGIKVWITAASGAERLLVLARTSGKRSAGISCFLVDADAPGMTIRDLRDITGGHDEFGEVILDDVHVDESSLLGEIDGGWQVTLGQLDDERRRGAFEEAAELDHFFDRLVEAGWESSFDPTLPTRIGRAWASLTGLKALNRRATEAMDAGHVLPHGLVTKLVFSETGQQIADLSLDALGARGVLASNAPAAAAARTIRLSARAYSIYAGSTEIMRSLIAEQILKLPRSR